MEVIEGILFEPMMLSCHSMEAAADLEVQAVERSTCYEDVVSILMMNDADEAMRLTRRDPSGGIVSLHELPDFLRLGAAENGKPSSTVA